MDLKNNKVVAGVGIAVIVASVLIGILQNQEDRPKPTPPPPQAEVAPAAAPQPAEAPAAAAVTPETAVAEAEKPGNENPFLTEEENRSSNEVEILPLEGYELSAVFCSPREAVINGMPVREGDTFEGKQVVQIRPDGVVLRQGRTRYIVKTE